jgi:Co/Zn/Cd efflux system component
VLRQWRVSFGIMSDCCDNGCALEPVNTRQKRSLAWVLAINAVMFMAVAVAALFADSSSLLSGSIDNLGDAITYALSLWAVSRGGRAKARVSLFKGVLILVAALAVTAHLAYKLMHPAVPVFELMGLMTVAGLVGNVACLLILRRHRGEDINMDSVWECARNDVLENITVLFAAVGVWLTASQWPDTVLAIALVALLYRSAFRIIRRSVRELRTAL